MSTTIKLQAQCNECHSKTLHDVLFEKEDSGTEQIDDDYQIHWGKTWQVIQCRGCESISMRMDAWDSESTEYHGKPIVDTTYFPPRSFREVPSWLASNFRANTCLEEVAELMQGLYIALQNDCNAAATMLMRAVFEHTMVHKVGDQGSFAKNLNEFELKGYISHTQREVVESMLEAGHASIHRAFIPKKEDIVALTDILEVVLNVIYVQAPKAHEIKKRIPKTK